MGESHPAVPGLLRFFDYQHLPEHLQQTSAPFAEIAHAMAAKLSGPELTAGLRKLLEAKDCFVRATLDAPPPPPTTGTASLAAKPTEDVTWYPLR